MITMQVLICLIMSTLKLLFIRARTIYRQVILSDLIYRFQIWHKSVADQKKLSKIEKMLQDIQIKCLKVITEVYNTILIKMLYNKAKLQLISIILN